MRSPFLTLLAITLGCLTTPSLSTSAPVLLRGPVTPDSPIVQELLGVVAFCQGKLKLDAALGEKFPDLAADFKLADEEFQRTTKEAMEGIEARLRSFPAVKWDEYRDGWLTNLDPVTKKTVDKASRELALTWLEETRDMAKGTFRKPATLQMLRAFTPSFLKNPELEFTSGYTTTFCSTEHAKAKGVAFTMKYPFSWRTDVDSGPGGLLQFTGSEAGYGPDVSMIIMRQLPADERAAPYTVDFARSYFEKPSSKFLSYTQGKLPNGTPMGIVHAEASINGIEAHALYHYFVREGMLIAISFSSIDPNGSEARAARVEHLQPLIDAIIGSITFPK